MSDRCIGDIVALSGEYLLDRGSRAAVIGTGHHRLGDAPHVVTATCLSRSRLCLCASPSLGRRSRCSGRLRSSRPGNSSLASSSLASSLAGSSLGHGRLRFRGSRSGELHHCPNPCRIALGVGFPANGFERPSRADTIFIPKNSWHAFKNPDSELLLLWVVAPPQLAAFLREFAARPGAPPVQRTKEQKNEIAQRYGTEFK